MKNYSPYQFSILRILLGAYCALYFVSVFPFASDLFSSEGMLPEKSMNLFYGAFPNILYLNDSPQAVQVLLIALIGSSLLFTLGSWRRFTAVLMWYGLACLFNRNNLFWSPAFPLIGWLLLATLFVPSGEPLSIRRYRNSSWQLPKALYIGAWAVLAACYSLSGLYKLLSPSWLDGSALAQTLRWTWARDYWYPDLLLSAPEIMQQSATWITLVLELGFIFCVFFPKGRMFAWWAMTLTHLNILLLLDLTDLTLGVLMFHLFVLDTSWFSFSRRKEAKDFAPEQPRRTATQQSFAAAAAVLLAFAILMPQSSNAEAPLEINPLLPLKTQYNQLTRDCQGQRDSPICKKLESAMLDKMKKLREICRSDPDDQRCGALGRPKQSRTNRMELYCFENPHATKCIRRREQGRRRQKLLRKFCGKNPDEKRCEPKRIKAKDNRSYIARLCDGDSQSVRCENYRRKKKAKYGGKEEDKRNAF